MIKVFLILFVINLNFLLADQQIFVISNDFNATTAKMFCFEDEKIVFSDIDVNLGRNGLAWDSDDKIFTHTSSQPIKHEGDGKSPAGIFAITSSFGYEDQTFLIPYHKSAPNLICVDDVNSTLYNTIVSMPQSIPASFEYMKRQDEQYKLGGVIAYNPMQIKNRGSCIFLHVEKEKNHPTSGCTSMSYDSIERVMKWLDISKRPLLIQIPKSSFYEALSHYKALQYFIKINSSK